MSEAVSSHSDLIEQLEMGSPVSAFGISPARGEPEEFLNRLVMVKRCRLRDGSRTKEGDRLSRLARVPETMTVKPELRPDQSTRNLG